MDSMPVAIELDRVTLSRRMQEEFHYDVKRSLLRLFELRTKGAGALL